MKDLPKLEELSIEAREALIYQLWEQVQRLEQEVAKLQEKLEKKAVKKTSANSSLPPSEGFKPENKSAQDQKKKRQGHQNGGRELDQTPNQIIIVKANHCPHCQTRVEAEEQKLQAVYEKIEDRKSVV